MEIFRDSEENIFKSQNNTSIMANKLQQSILALEKISRSQKITPKTKKEVEEHIKKVFK